MVSGPEQPGDDRLFRELTLCLCGTLELRSALKGTLSLLRGYFPADGLSLAELDHVAGCVRLIAAHTELGDSLLVENSVIHIPRQLLQGVSNVGLPIGPVINRPPDTPALVEIRTRYGVPSDISQLDMQLYRDERTICFVSLAARGLDRYTAFHQRLFERLQVPFSIALRNALRYEQVQQLRAQLESDNTHLRDALRQGESVVIGEQFGLRGVMQMLSRVAPTDSPVVLLGETGCGKEVIANALHSRSKRSAGPMLRVNCGAIPESLIESELFGHERGAFTGACATRFGLFERADGGTLFLDEVGELSPAAQVKLLRVLQTSLFERVGGSKSLRTDVRVVAATHRNLPQMVRTGRFREDLWYRLNVFPIAIPPLRERRDDIPTLTRHFMQQHAREMGLPFQPTLSSEALDQLLDYDWPGNVRELRNVVERALILCQGRPLSFPALGVRQRAVSLGSPVAKGNHPTTFDDATAQHIRRALAATGGRIKGPGGAAELLGLAPSTLRNKMKRLGLVG